MAANTIGYDVVARSISDAATDVGALVVKQALEISERYLPPRANLDLDTTINVIRHARPRMIYLAEDTFEIDSEIAELIETARNEEGGSEEGNSQFSENPMSSAGGILVRLTNSRDIAKSD
jgi:hypothetical protein